MIKKIFLVIRMLINKIKSYRKRLKEKENTDDIYPLF